MISTALEVKKDREKGSDKQKRKEREREKREGETDGEKESETDRQTEGETLAADDEKQIVWEKVEVEGACKSEERGLTRCRGGSQGTWEMHSSRCQSPHQAARSGPTGPHHEVAGPESHRRDSGRRPSRSCGIASLDNPTRTGRSPPSRVTGMIEWWKNSSGTAKRIDDDEERKKRMR